MSETMKPCPRGCARVPYLYGASGDGFYVRCRDCMVSGPLCAHGDRAIAEWNAAWNRRAEPTHSGEKER